MKANIQNGIFYLPADFPTEEGVLCLNRSFDGRPALFTPGQWTRLQEKITTLPNRQKSRTLQRFLMQYFFHVDVVDRKFEIPMRYRESFLRDGPARIVLSEQDCYEILQEE